jgi:hypothetical protein
MRPRSVHTMQRAGWYRVPGTPMYRSGSIPCVPRLRNLGRRPRPRPCENAAGYRSLSRALTAEEASPPAH